MADWFIRRFLVKSANILMYLTLHLCGNTASAQSVALTLQSGHHNYLNSIVFSPDGQQLVTGGADKTAILWDVKSGRTIRRFVHGGLIISLAISQDGKKLLTAGDGIRIWNLATGSEIGRIPFNGVARAAFFSANGKSATIAGSGQVKVFNTDLGSEERSLSARPGEISSFAISKDGQTLIFSDEKGALKLWNIKEDRQIAAMDADSQIYHSFAFSIHKNWILAGTQGGLVRLLDSNNGREIRRFTGPKSLADVALSPDDRLAIASSADGKIYAWDTETGSLAWTREGYSRSGNISSVDPSGQHLAIAYYVGVDLLSPRSGELIRNFASPYAEISAIALRPGHQQLVAVGRDAKVNLWDFDKGRVEKEFAGHERGNLGDGVTSVAFSADGKMFITGGADGTAKLWNVDLDQATHSLAGHGDTVTSVALSPDGKYSLTGSDDRTARVWSSETGALIREFSGNAGLISAVAFSQDGSQIFTGGSDANVWRWDAVTGKRSSEYVGLSRSQPVTFNMTIDSKKNKIRSYERRLGEVLALAVSQDGKFLMAGSRDGVAMIWDIATGKVIHRLSCKSDVTAVSFSEDSNLAILGCANSLVSIWRIDTGSEVRRFSGHSDAVTSLASAGRLLMTGSKDGTSAIWSTTTGERIVTLAKQREGGWLAISQDGRFDTDNVEQDVPLSWVASDQALRPLPPEIFMRDYYEPRLLSRLLACRQQRDKAPKSCEKAFQRLRPLVQLNRVQPGLRKPHVAFDPNGAAALVTVMAARGEDDSQTNGKTKTAPYDVRLFRNGQLVGQWPQPSEKESGRPQDIQAWRKASVVPMVKGQTKAEHTFRVALPSRDRGKPVVFTAYAFNEDRVKSETARNDEFKVPEEMALRKPRAYVITVGVNSYDNPDRNLSFAAKDARDMGAVLSNIKDYEMVRLTLVSETAQAGNAAVRQATKANIRAVLELLAGKSEGERARLKRVPGIDKNDVDRIAKATPDDLVLIAFSGHGYTSPSGQFYLLPSDSGAESKITPAVLPKFISSEDLSRWLREVDAGQMAMIIDACHSAASVETPGFKPGPMGDRGLGQLAYDKGMMILAATQASDVALEVGKIQQGLLTYALVQDGLQYGESEPKQRNADHNKNGSLTLKEWLKYGERRVPGLYEDIRSGKVPVVRRDAYPTDPNWRNKTAQNAQTPSLFDYQRGSDSVVVAP